MTKTKEELKKFLQEIESEEIKFTSHFYDKQAEDRKYLSEELITKSLKDTQNFLGFQDQSRDNKEKYRIGIKLSGKYDLVVVCEAKDKVLNIITAWKTNRRWQKSILK